MCDYFGSRTFLFTKELLMKKNSCPNCGLNDFIFKEGFAICQYCNSKFVLEKDDLPIKGSNISLQYDISILL